MTKQKLTLLEELRSVKTHPTAQVLFKMVRRRIPSIGFGTVYRNLGLLRDEGKVLELACEKSSAHYDGDTSNHHHLICLKCEKIFDLDRPALKNLNRRVRKASNFSVLYHRVNFYGYCKGCKKIKEVNEDGRD